VVDPFTRPPETELPSVARIIAQHKAEQARSEPPPAKVNGSSSNGYETVNPGIFDKFAQLATWADILQPAGWKQVKPPDAATSEAWQRPGGTHPVSAKVLKANPHVLVVHSEDAGLPVGGGQKQTKARLHAHLHYGGNESAFAKDLIAGTAVGVPTIIAAALAAEGAAKPAAVTGESSDPATEQTEVDRRYLSLLGEVLDADGLRKITPPEPLVEGYLFKNTLAWFSGSPGHGKSFGAVDVGCSVATGTDWHGHRVEQGTVLYLIAEGAPGLSQRVDAWEADHGIYAEHIKFLPVPVQIGKPDTVDVKAFAMLLDTIKPVLVIIDTQARVTVGCEENSNKDMGMFVDVLETLRSRTQATMLIVHHTPRNGDNLRGAVALEGAATSIIHFAKNGDSIELTNQKQKDAPEQPVKQLTLRPSGDSAVLSQGGLGPVGPTGNEQKVLDILAGFPGARAGKTELKEASGLAKTSWYTARNGLLAKGLMVEESQGNSTIYTVGNPDPTLFQDE
jgi:hypothetical protein